MSQIVTVLALRLSEGDTGEDPKSGTDEDNAAIMLGAAQRRIRHHHGDVSVDKRGSLLTAVFGSASDAVAAAVEVQQAARDFAPGDGAARIGIDVGEMVPAKGVDGSDAAARARQLASIALPGQILATGLVQGLAGVRPGTTLEPVEGTLLAPDLGLVFSVEWTADVGGTGMRVVVADDAALIRSGLAQLLEGAGFVVLTEAADADELLSAVAADPPDLVVTDIRMPPTNTDEGLRAAATIRSEHDGVAVLVLSQHVEARAAAALLDGRPAGIGYLLKERVSDLAEFVDACIAVANGGSVIDPLITDQLIARRRDDEALARLSARETEVLELMAQGKSNRAIADELFVGSKTVETHVGSIFRKLGINDTAEGNRRVQAVLTWFQS